MHNVALMAGHVLVDIVNRYKQQGNIMPSGLIFSATIFVLLSAINSHSQESIKIGSMQNYAPYNFESKNGKYIGIDVAIIETVLSELGLTAVHEPRPWPRAVIEFEEYKTDALFQLTATTERFLNWNMVGPIRSNARVYFVRANSSITDITSINDLKGLNVGVIRGYAYSDEFMKANDFEKEYVTDIVQNVMKLALGRVDIVIANKLPFKLETKMQEHENTIRMLPTPILVSERYIAFHKDEKGNALAKRFQIKLDELKLNGRVQKIIDSWHE